MPAAYASESYTVVAGTEVIGEGAFSCCSKLKNIELPSTVNKIGEMAFFETVIQSIRIPDGVTKLETLTFAFCSDLKTVFIPASVTEISSGAFDDAQFETVYFGGTKEQWQSCGGEAEVDVGVIKFNQK